MAFLAGNIHPALGYERIKAQAAKTKAGAQQMSAQLNVDVSSTVIGGIHQRLTSDRNRLASMSAVPGLAAYATAQESDTPGYDVIAEYTTLVSLIDAAIATIEAVNPATFISGWSLAGGFQYTTLTTAQTAGLKADLDAIAAQVA